MKSTFISIQPQNPRLREYIKCYYLHYNKDPAFRESIIYYPNYTTTINAYFKSRVSWDNNERTHTAINRDNLEVLLVGKINRTRAIRMLGPFYKIGIVFHPLGLNHFIDESLSTIVEEHFSFFNYYGKSFYELLKKLESECRIEIIRDSLDDYFLKQFVGFSEFRIKEAVKLILKSEEELKVGELAKMLNISDLQGRLSTVGA